MFGGKSVKSLEEFDTKNFVLYNRLVKTPYNTQGYLEGVERVQMDYKELFHLYKNSDEEVIFIIDPPYLSTDVSTYNNVDYWRLKDYLNIVVELNELDKYFYFGSNKGQLFDLFEHLVEYYNIKNPFANTIMRSTKGVISNGLYYEDIMVYRV